MKSTLNAKQAIQLTDSKIKISKLAVTAVTANDYHLVSTQPNTGNHLSPFTKMQYSNMQMNSQVSTGDGDCPHSKFHTPHCELDLDDSPFDAVIH